MRRFVPMVTIAGVVGALGCGGTAGPVTFPDLRQLDPTHPVTADRPPPAPRPNKLSVAQDVSPPSGPTTGGTVVTLQVWGINRNASVTFCGKPAAAWAVQGSNGLTTVTPPHAAGDCNVGVDNHDGDAVMLVQAFRFTE